MAKSNKVWVVTKNGNFQGVSGTKDGSVGIMRLKAGVEADRAAVEYKDGLGLKDVGHFRARETDVQD